jgi:hypothetical protein
MAEKIQTELHWSINESSSRRWMPTQFISFSKRASALFSTKYYNLKKSSSSLYHVTCGPLMDMEKEPAAKAENLDHDETTVEKFWALILTTNKN